MPSLKIFSRLISIVVTFCFLYTLGLETSLAVQDLPQASLGSYNGDPFADLVVGVPHENLLDTPGSYNNGMIHVIHGFPQGLGPQDNETWDQDMDFSQDRIERIDQFGRSLASGDFDGDGYYDVAVGVPYETINDGLEEIRRAGAVHIIYGSSAGGLTAAGNQFLHQDSPDVAGIDEADDNFGYSLAVGNFNGDEYDDLAIGVPGEDFEYSPTLFNGGSVNVIYGSANGLDPVGVLPDKAWNQDSYDDDGPEIIDGVEGYEEFGYALTVGNFDGDAYDDLAIGAPGESSSTKSKMGVVHILYGTQDGLKAEGNKQLEQFDWGGSAESETDDQFGKALAAGDFERDGFDDLAVGVPREDITPPSGSPIMDAGAVNVYTGSNTGLREFNVEIIYQDGEMIAEQGEKSDNFGHTLAAVDFTGTGLDNLVVGVPFKDFWEPYMENAGALYVLSRAWVGGFVSDDPHFFHQGREVIPGDLGQNHEFGYALAPGDYNGDGKEDLAIGVPGDNCNVYEDGSVVVIYSDTWDGLGAVSPQYWCQGGSLKDQGEIDDGFGFSLAALPSSGSLPFRSYLPSILRDE